MNDAQHAKPDALARLRALYPQLTETQLMEAQENLRAYVAVVLRVFERREREAKERTETHQL